MLFRLIKEGYDDLGSIKLECSKYKFILTINSHNGWYDY